MGHIVVKNDIVSGDDGEYIVGNFRLLADLQKDEVYGIRVVEGKSQPYPLALNGGVLVELTDHPIDLDRVVHSKMI